MEPKIRLKGFIGDWGTAKIGTIAPITGGYAFQSNCFVDNGIPIVRISNILDSGVVGGNFAFYDSFPGDEQFKLYKDDIVIAMSGATTGKVAIIKDEKTYYQNQRVGKFSKTGKVDYSYLSTIVSSDKFLKELYRLLTASAQPNASSKDIDSISIPLPQYRNEQEAIASYFTNLDTFIQSTTKKIESLKQVKVASLQSMFPQEGETKPRVRFKGFEGEWGNVSLGEETYPAGIKNHDNLPLESYSISNEYGFIPQNVQFENGGTMATADKRMYYIVSKNSFGYNPARINVGSLGYYTGDNNVIVSSLYEIFKTSDRICDTFLLYWFKTSTFQKLIEQYQEGGVRFYFFYDKLCMCHTLIPSYEEQQKIANYFINLDTQITLQTQRLEKLKQIKSACLDNMFV